MPRAFTSSEKALLELSDEEIDQLGEDAQKDDVKAREKLQKWAWVSARAYYFGKVNKGELGFPDAEELISSFNFAFRL